MILTNERNNQNLFYGGFEYWYHYSHKTKNYFRCTFVERGCPGRLFVTGWPPTPQHIIVRNVEHTHDAVNNRPHVAEYKAFIKQQALLGNQTVPVQILADAASNFKGMPGTMPSRKNAKAIIDRAKAILKARIPDDPVERNTPWIPEQLLMADAGECCLIGEVITEDSTTFEIHRVSVFSTKKLMGIFFNALETHSDATFDDMKRKNGDAIFKQLYVLSGNLPQAPYISVPCIWVMMTGKLQVLYETAFDIIKAYGARTNRFARFTSHMSDMEAALRNAVMKAWPDIDFSFCNFHLSQAVIRQMQKRGLLRYYRAVVNGTNLVNFFTKGLVCLSFLPEHLIPAFFKELEDWMKEVIAENEPSFPGMKGLFEYFDAWYVKDRFPRACWSVHDRIVAGRPKTNNTVESTHAAFRRLVDMEDAKLYLVLGRLKQRMLEYEATWGRRGLKLLLR